MINEKITFYEFLEKEFADIDVYCGINKLSHYDSAKLTWDFVESQKNQEIEELKKKIEELEKSDINRLFHKAMVQITNLENKLGEAVEVIKFYSIAQNYGYNRNVDNHIEWISDEEHQSMGKKARTFLKENEK